MGKQMDRVSEVSEGVWQRCIRTRDRVMVEHAQSMNTSLVDEWDTYTIEVQDRLNGKLVEVVGTFEDHEKCKYGIGSGEPCPDWRKMTHHWMFDAGRSSMDRWRTAQSYSNASAQNTCWRRFR